VNSENRELVDIKSILKENQETLKETLATMVKIQEGISKLVKLAQKDDFIFAYNSKPKSSLKSSLISDKSPPVFDTGFLRPDLKEIDDTLLKELKADQTKQNLVLAIVKRDRRRATADDLADELGLARSTCALYLNRLVEKKVLGKERGNAMLDESNRKMYFFAKGHSSIELSEQSE